VYFIYLSQYNSYPLRCFGWGIKHCIDIVFMMQVYALILINQEIL